MHTRSRALAACSALVIACVLAAPVVSFAQDKKAAKPDKAWQAEIDAAVRLVDGIAGGQPAPTDVAFTWSNHSMKSADGKIFVPFTLTFDKEKTPPPQAVYYIRAVSRALAGDSAKIAAAKAAAEKAEKMAQLDPENVELADQAVKARAAIPKVEPAFEDMRNITFKAPETGQPFRFQRAIGVAPGDYDVYVAIKEPAAAAKGKKTPLRAGVLKVALTVPNYWSDELATSALIVTNKAEPLPAPLPADQAAANPYVFGQTRVTLPSDMRFAKKDELIVFFYVYNVQMDKTVGKPNVSIDYGFWQKTGTTEKFFNKTAPAEWNAKTLPPNFDPAVHQLPGNIAVPLASFPEGDYRLEIKVKDNVSGKTKTENVQFTVIPG